MSPVTFHPFPNLPYEIRQQIWEDACFDWRGSRFGLHYIKLNKRQLLPPFNCEWQTTGRRNRSAYLWHANLWTACKESRDIAAKHWRKQGRPDVQETDKYEIVGDIVCDRLESYADGHRVTHTKGDYEPWHQIVDIRVDIFCITAELWDPLLKDWEPLYTPAKSIQEIPWQYCLGNGFSRMALEFDPSWSLMIENFTRNNCIADYPPSLQFLIRILMDHAHCPHCAHKLILIDKHSLWYGDEEITTGDNPVYVDCDYEYVQHTVSFIGPASPLSRFLRQLGGLIGRKLDRIASKSIYHGGQHFYHLYPEKLLNVIVRRDNQRPLPSIFSIKYS
ncbi:hypothetical protein FNAPI_8493 [Fusarium napiforme]|uniref:2EXR domain-containing protein n=1 Tax=Fusarium napiforme TaxID=42672 RepID=A0A8H5J3V3_9HYPO|nr:hypothetical protein FNAPI_8493 [Fusarium napiforme]